MVLKYKLMLQTAHHQESIWSISIMPRNHRGGAGAELKDKSPTHKGGFPHRPLHEQKEQSSRRNRNPSDLCPLGLMNHRIAPSPPLRLRKEGIRGWIIPLTQRMGLKMGGHAFHGHLSARSEEQSLPLGTIALSSFAEICGLVTFILLYSGSKA